MKLRITQYPTEQLISKNRQWPQWLAIFSASLSYFAGGICFCWSSPSLAILQSSQSPFPVTEDEASWIASFLPIGCAVGPVIGAYLARYLGPKHTILTSVFPLLAGFVLIIFATGPYWLYASRFLSGLGVGIGQTAAPIYGAEISENHNRGAIMSFLQLTMAGGALFVSSIAPYVSLQRMAEISSIFPCLLLVTLVLVPDSPYFLMRIGKEEKATKSLQWLRRQKNSNVIQEELKSIRKITSDNINMVESIICLKDKPNPKALLLVNISFVTQQFTGAVVVLFYQEQIYQVANAPIKPDIAVIITSVIGTVASLVSVLFIDSWGRKPLIIFSSLGCATSTALMGSYLFFKESGLIDDIPNINWISIVAMNALQVFFAFGVNSVPSAQLGEMFSSNVKEVTFCLLSVIAAVEGFIVTKSFQLVKDEYGLPTVFMGFSVFTIIFLILICILIPETKGKSFLEIQEMLMSPRDTNKSGDIKLQEITRY